MRAAQQFDCALNTKPEYELVRRLPGRTHENLGEVAGGETDNGRHVGDQDALVQSSADKVHQTQVKGACQRRQSRTPLQQMATQTHQDHARQTVQRLCTEWMIAC